METARLWIFPPLVIVLAFLLDALIGDPPFLPHPVRAMGFLTARGENLLRRLLPRREGPAGTLLVIAVASLSFFIPLVLLRLSRCLSVWVEFILGTIFSFQCLAARQLGIEALKVYRKTLAGDLDGARQAVSMIVGRDTENLSLEGVNKAAVETVAENLSDGVIAPLFFLALGGAPLAMLYKAVNTMDSMIGYKDSRYLHFGRCAAKLDDALNLLPARISGPLLIAAAALLGFDARNAARVYCRDRKKHASPNSAHGEAACAGALGLALAGDAFYGGRLESKPVIGDGSRPIESEDIRRAVALMYVSTLLFVPAACLLRLGVCAAAFFLTRYAGGPA
jgi:adenosylcobinamide-phosphate synthase